MNVNLPARCASCGFSFLSGLVVTNNARNSVFANNSTSCPQCGGEADIQDVETDGEGNIYFVMRRAFSILRASTVNRSELERLREVLEQARAGKLTEKQVRSHAARINPSFRDLVVPKDAGDFWTIIGIIIAVIFFVLKMHDDPNIEVNETTINNYLQLTPIVQPFGRPAPSPSSSSQLQQKTIRKRIVSEQSVKVHPKGWKNSRCNCGSGKRSRDCCGRR